MKYRKVSESEVLIVLCSVAVCVMNPIGIASARIIADNLKTSKYQVRKHLNSLKEKGLAEPMFSRIVDWEEETSMPYRGWGITVKAKETKEYSNEKEKEKKLLKECFGIQD